MIRIQLPFDLKEEQDHCERAVEWLVERLGYAHNLVDIHHSYRYHKSWRYLSPVTKERISDYLNQKGGWLMYGDLYVGHGPDHHYQQFLIQDPSIATLFKLTFA